MTDYIKHKEYKLPNGRTVTADFNELGYAMITLQAMDALFDIFNSYDVVEVVRCKDCKYHDEFSSKCNKLHLTPMRPNYFCSYGERAEA